MKDAQLKHLEFIQSTINRMTANSFMLKGWTITLISGLFALSFFSDTQWITLIPILPVLSFWGLDAYFLRQEKLFRELYDYSRKAYINKINSIDLLSLNATPYENNVQKWICLVFSKTIFWFYGIITFIVIARIVWLIFSLR